MRARSLARFLVALTLVAVVPAHAGDDLGCERALSKSSAKFVGAAIKSVQRCLLLKSAGKLPVVACDLAARSTGDAPTDRALAHAEARLAKGLATCSDGRLATMDFQSSCRDGGRTGAFTRADLNRCISQTHMAAVQALASVEFPQLTSDCGDGAVEDAEDCDPVASPSGCAEGETCVPAGTPDECTCIESGGATCGNGTIDAGEQCDPVAAPAGCSAGLTCAPAGGANACTCVDASGSQCQGTCTPTCAAEQSCTCTCVGPSPTCGNGTKEAGEQCDPMANPSGCAPGLVCGSPGTASQCTCFTGTATCGNGKLDAGEACDPALPNTCDPGEVCLESGTMACTCGAPPANCGNGLIEWGEQCDPGANPTGCPTGMTCTACTCGGGTTTTSLPGGTTTTTSLPGGTTTTTIAPGACCGPERITLRSTPGTLTVDNLAPFPFPNGVITTMDTGAASGAAGECRHAAVVPAGGFFVPHFDIPALNYCSEIVDLHCESGAGEGAGALWDGHGSAGVAMTNVTKVADTSDGTCNPAGQPCTTGPGGAGANTLGDVDESVAAAPGGGVRSLLDIRAQSITWSDSQCSPATSAGCCVTSSYGDDTAANGELLITRFDFILSPSTNTATASFVDKNTDGCKRAGSGFNNPGPDGPKSLTGSPASGPCCVAGQATTVVAVGVGFSGGAPLFDLGFQSTIPNTVAACGTPGAATCVVTTDACLE